MPSEHVEELRRALEMTVLQGVKTTIPLHLRILEDPDFLRGDVTTRFIDRWTRVS